ncbi:hypothetical protein NFI96_017114, partial [Prochilodus magdalenae]
MVLPYRLNILRVTVIVVVTCTGWSFAEKRLLCSSESGSIWYDYEVKVLTYQFSATETIEESVPLRFRVAPGIELK